MRNLTATMIAVGMLFTGLSTANAQHVALQARWQPVTLGNTTASLFGDTGFGAGLRLDQLVVRASLAIQYATLNNKDLSKYDYSDATPDESYESESTWSGTLLTPGVQVQYYFTSPQSGGFAPYGAVKVAKAFAFGSQDEEWEDCVGDTCTKGPDDDTQTPFEKEYEEEMESYTRGLLSPWIFTIGAGLEYFFNDAISLGLETGARIVVISGSAEASGADDVTATDVTRTREANTSLNLFDVLYGNLTLNMYW